jgi:MerR family transcriptional regulator, mercuric resistance operon regulatory protein
MKSAKTTLGIGELARLAECGIDTIRYYERVGLLPAPERSAGGQRRYAEQRVRQLLFIRRLRDLGFSLDEVGEFLVMRRQQSYNCTDFKKLADARIAQICRQREQLKRLERRLRDISAHCAEGAAIRCGVIEALWTADALDLALAQRGGLCSAAPTRQ